MRHRWTKVHIGTLISGGSHRQVCKECGMIRCNAYQGKLQYYLPDGTPVNRAGECGK